MPSFYNLVKVFVSGAPGVGNIACGSAVPGFLTPAQAGVVDGATVVYEITSGSDCEIGVGTYTAATNNIARTTVRASSNAGAQINAGALAVVVLTVGAEDIFSGDYNALTNKPTLGGAAALNVGTTTGTVSAGNDSRITGAAQKASNLSDLASILIARTNLGLGGAATLNVGTTAGTIAAGDDSRIVGAAQKASNLSDLANVVTARTNLGLGGAATLNVGTAAGTVAAGNDSRITGALQALSNLSDLSDAPTARANLGLGSAATYSSASFQSALGYNPVQTGTGIGQLGNVVKVGWSGAELLLTVDSTDLGNFLRNAHIGTQVASYTDSRITGAAQKSSNLSDLANAATARTNLGLGTAATLNTGTASGNIPVLGTGGALPAIPGGNLTGIVTSVAGLTGAVTADALTGALALNYSDLLSTSLQKTAAFTIALTDIDNFLFYNSASAATCTLPTDATAPVPNGTLIFGTQWGVGALTFAAESGATVVSEDGILTTKQQRLFVLWKRAANAWMVFGVDAPYLGTAAANDTPTSSTLPVGACVLMQYNPVTAVANGSTTAGSNLNTAGGVQTEIPASSGVYYPILAATSAVQSGTWKNVSGASISAISNKFGLFVRTV